MDGQWSRPTALTAAGFLWPAVIAAVATLWPGPSAPAPYEVEPDIGRTAGALPATDLSGSTSVFAADNGPTSARVFWEVPRPGRVHLTIELDPEQDGAEPATGPGDPADATPE